MFTHRAQLLGFLFVLAFAVAACGGDDAATTVATTVTASTEATTTTTAAPTTTVAEETTTTEVVETTTTIQEAAETMVLGDPDGDGNVAVAIDGGSLAPQANGFSDSDPSDPYYFIHTQQDDLSRCTHSSATDGPVTSAPSQLTVEPTESACTSTWTAPDRRQQWDRQRVRSPLPIWMTAQWSLSTW